MTKLQKFIVLVILSLSVYFVYQKTNNNTYQILNISDNYFNINNKKQKNYLDYYKKDLLKEKKEVKLHTNYTSTKQSINNTLNTVKNNSKIKADLINTDQLLISLGYNDLLYNIAIEDKMTEKKLNKIINNINKDYNDLINEIQKYYHRPIIVIGYYEPTKNNYFIKAGITKLNKMLKNNKKVKYIDTYYLLQNKNKYFLKSNNNYLNSSGSYTISKKIINKILEIS